ncbi:putative cytosolic Fe-S cluster assembly factor AAEL012261 [Dermatophagoides pteronyssinus]|uniref:putative cytosolic Fe-S cluster assembly factor AAEL012261 n=1 Tax=Dermatophagoides pteronyssinus TaxID=6956 RepID=UPI003F66B4B1
MSDQNETPLININAGDGKGQQDEDDDFDFYYDYAKAAQLDRSGCWTEQNWQEEMEKHPLFATKAPEPGQEQSELIDAFSQLKYDPEFNSIEELMNSYRQDGNENFRHKKYRWAIDSYSEGIRLAFKHSSKNQSSENIETNKLNESLSVLYNNRSSAHFHLGNYRSSMQDATRAMFLNQQNLKAKIRFAQCCCRLKRFEQCIIFCKKELDESNELKIENEKAKEKFRQEMQTLLEEAEKKFKIQNRDERKSAKTEQKRSYEQKQIEQAVQERGIKFQGSLFETDHPTVRGCFVHFDSHQTLVWPVVFIYPDVGQTDFIEKFSENSTFAEYIEMLFETKPEWDQKNQYRPERIRCYYQSCQTYTVDGEKRIAQELELIEFDRKLSLLKVLQLDDYIVQNAVCIKPAETIQDNKSDNSESDDIIRINKSSKSWKNRQSERIQGQIKEGGDTGQPKLTPVSVTLGDCLACSGCITSTEAVLISEQSHEKVIDILDEKQKNNNLIIVMTLSLQALASLAAKYNLDSIQSAAERISYLFHSLGVDYIFDIALARHICLQESWQELSKQYNSDTNSKQPLLSSTCPGFVCYAEKSQGNILVPLLSRIKSPQQIMGLLVKKRLHLVNDQFVDVQPDRIYHITLMPCYDKKLEASRLENRIDESIKEVDCVITPLEVEKILEFKQIENLDSLPCRPLDQFNVGFSPNGEIQSHRGSGSGGYADNLLRMMAIYQKMATKELMSTELEWKIVRNADFLEINLHESETDTKPVISFAILNGFRNIQNLVSRLKRKSCPYDYIEVSACPKGCLNGGAQFRNIPFNKKLNEKLTPDSDPIVITFEQVQKLYDQLPKTGFDFFTDNEMIDNQTVEIYSKLQLDDEFREKFRTEFRILEKKFNILNSNW